MRVLFILMACIATSAFASGTTTFDKQMDNLRSEKFEEVGAFLKTNYRQYQKHPEYYVLLLNYSFLSARNSQLTIGSGEPGQGDLTLRSQKDKQIAGFIGERVYYDKSVIREGIEKAQSALKHFPNRLDIHFGITHIAKQSQLWKVVGQQSVTIIETSKLNKNKWLWGNIGSMSGSPKAFMLQNIASNSSALFRAENNEADAALEAISKALVEHYPNEVYGHSNLGLLASVRQDYALAKKYFETALEVAPGDEVVIQNLKHIEGLMSK